MKYNTVKIERKNSKFNYYTITDKKRYLLSDWVDHTWAFSEGFAIVSKDGKENYIRRDGTFLLPEWVEACYDFQEGFGEFRKEDGWYKVDKDGNIIVI